MDAFYEEDERILGHAADSYHRIDIRQASRNLWSAIMTASSPIGTPPQTAMNEQRAAGSQRLRAAPGGLPVSDRSNATWLDCYR
jgi:hypothetical protein